MPKKTSCILSVKLFIKNEDNLLKIETNENYFHCEFGTKNKKNIINAKPKRVKNQIMFYRLGKLSQYICSLNNVINKQIL